MAAWIGPAIVAALIAALINVVGWWVTFRQQRSIDVLRRMERIVDIQTALRAEIRSYRAGATADELSEHLVHVVNLLTTDRGFIPFLPLAPEPALYRAIIGDIHILPTDVIDAVVLFYTQLATIAHITEDLRSEPFRALPQDRKIAVFRDYVGLLQHALTLADKALAAIELSLAARSLNSSASGE